MKLFRSAAPVALVAGVIVLVLVLLTQPSPNRQAVELPPANGVFDYQLGGAYAPQANVDIVVRDRTNAPVSDKYNICYVNAFQTQPQESASFARDHPELLLRASPDTFLVDGGWPDEYIFDISTTAKRTTLSSLVGSWIDGCATAGFQAIEADNLDSYTRSNTALTKADAAAFATLLASRAHAAGLAIGQKNGGEFAAPGKTVIGFDFAVVEECQVYNECGAYTSVYGTQVFEIEYSDNGSAAYSLACAARGTRISVIYRDRDVVPRGEPGYAYQSC